MQGLPLKELAARYLDTGPDVRAAGSTLRWLRDEIVSLAGRSPRPELAALLRRSPWAAEDRDLQGGARGPKSPHAASLAPSLEEFGGRFPDGFYSEAELLELFQAEYPPEASAGARARVRRGRLIERQLAALRYLEPLLARPPCLSDRVTAWFPAVVAQRLTRADLPTLFALRSRFEIRGSGWWRTVPRLGLNGASRIERWWREHVETLGSLEQLRRSLDVDASTVYPANLVSVSQDAERSNSRSDSRGAPVSAKFCSSAVHAVVADRTEAPERSAGSLFTTTSTKYDIIAPMEFLRLPLELDGRFGRNRLRLVHGSPPADNDLGAIQLWLAQRSKSSSTWRSYRNEAERFLLWAVVERGCAFSDVTAADCVAYCEFLRDPQPSAQWVNQQPVARWSLAWRPFAGGLSASSVKHAQVVLRVLCEWLRRQRYLAANPWSGLPVPATFSAVELGASASPVTEWDTVERALDALPEGPGARRIRFLLRFLRETGLKRADVSGLRVGDVHWSPSLGCWTVWVKRGLPAVREVPLSTGALSLLVSYLARLWSDHGVGSAPTVERWLERVPGDAPLFGRVGGALPSRVALDPCTVYRVINTFFGSVNREQRERARQDQQGLSRISGQVLMGGGQHPAAVEFSPRDVLLNTLIR